MNCRLVLWCVLSLAGTSSFAQTVETVTLSGVINPRVNNGLVVSPSGVVYASDIFGQTGQLTSTRVFQIKPDGAASVVGTSFAQPAGLALDAIGRLYVANFNGKRISRVDADGAVETFVSTGLDRPAGLAFSQDGRLFVSDFGSSSIVAIDTLGNVSTFASGSPLSSPVGVAFDDEGILYVANLATSTITSIDSTGSMSTLATQIGGDLGFLTYAHGFLYVTSTSTSEVFRITRSGEVSRFAGTGAAGLMDGPLESAELTNPDGIAASPTGDTLYVSENNSHRLRRIVGLTTTAESSGGVPDTGDMGILDIYPTPTSGVAMITLALPLGVSDVTFRVSDMLGRKLRDISVIPDGSARKSVRIDLNDLSAGNYWVGMAIDGREMAGKSIVIVP